MNLSYLLASALFFLFAKAKNVVKKAASGLPPATENNDERDRADSLLDDGRDVPSLSRDEDEAMLDSEIDTLQLEVAERAYQRAIADGFHPMVADAVALEAYDEAGGQSLWYIEGQQRAIGAEVTGEFDEQTQDRIDLICGAAELARKSELKPSLQLPSSTPKLSPKPSPQLPSSPPKPTTAPKVDAQMFELKEVADWDLTPDQRRTHAAARKLALKEYQKARANGQSHQVGAAMWLGRYMKSGGTRKETVHMMQRECGMPIDQQSGVWDSNTKNWITSLTAPYRAMLAKKK